MRFEQAPLAGAYVIFIDPRGDERGSFGRTFCADEFGAHGLNTLWLQANTAQSISAGIVRGLHYQTSPHAEIKLVSCIKGRMFDVIVDVRDASPTQYQWFGVELSAGDNKQLYVPEGFAHGYQVLEPDTRINYLVSANYAPQAEAGVRWDDPAIGITWPITNNIELSDKDKRWALLG